MAATKTSPTDMIADRKAVLAKADEILEAMFLENRPANFDELDFLQSVVGWDRQKINDNYRRVSRRCRLQQIAGTSKDRDDLKKNADAAQAELAERGPELLDEIARLQAEHAKLEKTANSLSQRFEETQTALEQLTQVCSPSVTNAVNIRVHEIKSDLGQTIADMQIDLNEIKAVLAGPASQRNGLYWDTLKRFDRALVIETVVNGMITHSYSPAWPHIKGELEADLSERQTEIDRLQKLLDEELAKAREPLRQYWR